MYTSNFASIGRSYLNFMATYDTHLNAKGRAEGGRIPGGWEFQKVVVIAPVTVLFLRRSLIIEHFFHQLASRMTSFFKPSRRFTIGSSFARIRMSVFEAIC